MKKRAYIINPKKLILLSVILLHTSVVGQLIDKPGLWQSFGPFQRQAWIDVILPDVSNPGTLYTSSAGRLHKSTNYGIQWLLLTAPVNDLSSRLGLISDERIFVITIESLFYSEGDADWIEAGDPLRGKRVFKLKKVDNMLYAATFFDGLFFSTDNGNSWTQANPPMHNQFVRDIVKSGNSLYVYTNSDVFVSTNGGLDWVQTNPPMSGNLGVNYLFATEDALIAGVTTSGLFRSNDGGETWSNVLPFFSPFILGIKELNGRLFAWGFEDQGPTFTSQKLSTSADNGVTWTDITQNTGNVGVIDLISVNGTLVAGTHSSGIIVSENNGLSWQKVELPVQEFSGGLRVTSLASVERTLYAATLDKGVHTISSDEGGVFISTDNGRHWRKSTTGLSEKIKIDDFILDVNYIVAAKFGGGGAIYQSADLGLNWRETIHTEAQFFPQKIWNFNGVVLVSNDAGGGGDIRISQDGGISWTQGSLSVHELISVDGVLYGTFFGELYNSSDNGKSWARLQNQPSDGLSVLTSTLYSDNNTIYIGTSVGIFQSADGGDSWQQVDGSTLDRGISTIIKAEGVLYAGTNNAGVFKKTDQGWVQANPPVDSTRVLKIVPATDALFINTTSGVYFSNDGLNWTYSNFPANEHQVNSLIFAAGRIFAGTNTGVFWTENGTDWFPLNTDWDNVRVNKVVHLPVFGRLYAATDDGVYMQELDTTPPTADSLIINNNDPFTGSAGVDLILVANKADSMLISEDPAFADAYWEAQSTFRSFTLSNVDGEKTIYAKFKDISFNQSEILSAQINLDTTPPSFSPHTAPPNATPGSFITINQQVDEDNLESMVLRFRRSGETFNNSSREASFTNNTAVIDADWVRIINVKGIDYQIIAKDRVNPGDTLKNGALDFFSLPVNVGASALGNSRSLPSGTGGTAYRIVSMPMDLQNRPQAKDAFRNMGKYGRRGDWRFYAYSGNGQFQEGDNIQMQTGTGYFILRRDGGSLTNAVSGTTTRTSDGVLGNISGWQLRAGDWTLIGNPYNTRIELNQLMLKSDSTRLSQHGARVQVWGYDGGWKNPQTDAELALEPWSGLFVRAPQNDAIVFADAKEPYMRSSAFRLQKNTLKREHLTTEWQVQITASAGAFEDDVNFFGVKKDAKDALDDHDWYELPFLPGSVGLSFPHHEWSDPVELTADFRPVAGDGYRWEIAVKGQASHAVQLSFANVESVPDKYKILLVDETTQIARDLRKEKQMAVRIPTDADSRRLTVLVGNHQFISENTASMLAVPTDFALHQNYPNPFNPSTTIRYALPVAGKVTLKIFDLMGKEVLRLADHIEREAGYYEIVADMTRLGSGVYFYRIAVDGEQRFQATRKMLFVK